MGIVGEDFLVVRRVRGCRANGDQIFMEDCIKPAKRIVGMKEVRF